jgi:LPXTG-site transpeptidase (sortase) family protein
MFDQARTTGSGSRRDWPKSLLIYTGVLMLTVGALMVAPSLSPYVASRVYSPPERQTLASPTAPAPLNDDGPTATSAPELPPDVALLPLFDRTAPGGGAVEGEAGDAPVRPETLADTAPVVPPTRIVIPSIGIDTTVVPAGWEYTDVNGTLQPIWVVPEAPLAGWHDGTATLGAPGNTVLSGHNWPQNAVFRDLYQVQPGEQVLLYSDDAPYTYQIVEVLLLPEAGQPLEVRRENARYIQPTDDERVTLVTCHPYGQLTHRLIVIARPVDDSAPPTAEGQ